MLKANYQVSQATDQQFGLLAAIVLYGSNGVAAYATYNQVTNGTIRAGRPLSRSKLNDALRGLNNVSAEDLYVDERMLAKGDGFMVWWRKPQTTQLFFQTDKLVAPKGATAKSFSARLQLPGLVFIATPGTLHVFAVKGPLRPTREEPLFAAPFMNVWDGGKVCTGNVKLPQVITAASMSQWEDSFFRSRFTHFNTKTLVKYEGGNEAFLQDWLDGKFKTVPEDALVKTNSSIHSIVNTYAKSR